MPYLEAAGAHSASPDYSGLSDFTFSPDGTKAIFRLSGIEPDTYHAYYADLESKELFSLDDVSGRVCSSVRFTGGGLVCFSKSYGSHFRCEDMLYLDTELQPASASDWLGSEFELLMCCGSSDYALADPGDNTVCAMNIHSGEMKVIPALETDTFRSWCGEPWTALRMKYSPNSGYILIPKADDDSVAAGTLTRSWPEIRLIDLAAGEHILLRRDTELFDTAPVWLSEGVFRIASSASASDESPGFDICYTVIN